MWITRCAHVVRAAVTSHPLAVGIPAAVTTIGAGAALALVCATPSAKPDLACGCHQVWIAPVVPMTPKTYAKVIKTLSDAAINSVPADNSGGIPYFIGSGGSLGGTTNRVSILTNLPHGPPSPHLPRNVPEPSALALFMTGCIGLWFAARSGVRRG